jgi:hypothetical protein
MANEDLSRLKIDKSQGIYHAEEAEKSFIWLGRYSLFLLLYCFLFQGYLRLPFRWK